MCPNKNIAPFQRSAMRKHKASDASASTQDRQAAPTFADYGIVVPVAHGGEWRTPCPQCSHTRKKKSDKCLSINVTKGIWYCHHCGWKGALKQQTPYAVTPTAKHSQNAIDGALKITRAHERGDLVDDRLLAKAKAILQRIPPHAQKMSHRAQQEYDAMILKRAADACRNYQLIISTCDECGQPYDENATFPGSRHCMKCHAMAGA